MNCKFNKSAYNTTFQDDSVSDEWASQSLVRTVDHLKSTTTNMRGFADSVDHLLNALEEFYPFIDKFLTSTQSLRSNMHIYARPRYRYQRRR